MFIADETDPFPTSTVLQQHLLICGNKTDECPKCRRFIRRSHFAYHYENNCASIDDIETPPHERRIQIAQHSPVNRNRPYSREDIADENYPQQKNDKCLQNPSNINNRQQQQRKPFQPNQNRGSPSNGIVHVPCEICDQLIDLPNWSSHTQTCREREIQQNKNRARSMSKEPVTEQLPCEYCQLLCEAKQLLSHERNCSRNPHNMKEARRIVRPRPGQVVVLPVKEKPDNEYPIPPKFESPRREVHYEKLDIDQTHAANRREQGMRRSKSDERILIENGSPRDNHDHKNDFRRSRSRDRSYENLSKPRKFGSTNDNLRYQRASMENLRNKDSNEDPSRTIIYDRPLPNNHRIRAHVARHETGTFEVINNKPDTPLIKKQKKKPGGLVNEPIPTHPDAIYRPQSRPLPASHSPPVINIIAPRTMADAAVPLSTTENGFSPWWIIGPFLALLSVMALAALVYIKKKQADSENTLENNAENSDRDIPLKQIKSNVTQKTTSTAKESNFIENLFPLSPITQTSSTASTESQLSQSNANIEKKENQQKLNKDLSIHHEPSSPDHTFPDQHGVGKSPLISTIPTGSKLNEKEKSISKSSSSNPTLQISPINGKHPSPNLNKSAHNLLPNVPQCKTSTSSSASDDDFYSPQHKIDKITTKSTHQKR
ncbi:hypothetical protein I4U23_021584 [Adineta vaga]|nr:hypothetical protein I4U23_021584 [Adineta vaga]